MHRGSVLYNNIVQSVYSEKTKIERSSRRLPFVQDKKDRTGGPTGFFPLGEDAKEKIPVKRSDSVGRIEPHPLARQIKDLRHEIEQSERKKNLPTICLFGG